MSASCCLCLVVPEHQRQVEADPGLIRAHIHYGYPIPISIDNAGIPLKVVVGQVWCAVAPDIDAGRVASEVQIAAAWVHKAWR